MDDKENHNHDDHGIKTQFSKENSEHSEHHVLSNSMGLKILFALLALTFITVVASRIHFGVFNFPIAMAIATVKALLVVLYFMGLKYDNNENRVIFASSFVFAGFFIFFVAADIATRAPDYKVTGPEMKEASGGIKFKKPWVATDELKAHGKELFTANCVICHGPDGMGNGAAAAALNPKPRNFHQDEGWKNGRKPSEVFGTLTKGLGSMPSFSTLPSGDRWSLAHYILSLGPTPSADTDEDLKKAGIDPAKEDAAEVVKPTIPVDFAIDRYLSSSE